jgi:uncharacterized protein YbaP (TraB family)
MKKRLFIITLVLLVCFSVIGCSNNDVTNNSEAVTSETAENVVNATESAEVEETTEVAEEVVAYGDYKGFMWEVKNEDATVYLFGSIHMADESLYPMHETVEKAFEASDILGVEADVSDVLAIQGVAGLMVYEGDDNVYNHLSEEGIAKFESITETLGLSSKLLERFRVWVVGSNLMALQLMQSEYSATEGVDMYFLNNAVKTNKEIVELEGIEFQINMMNNFSDEEQESLFLSSLGSNEETIADFEKLYNYYLSADVESTTDYIFNTDAGFDENSELEDKMLKDRNIGMADKIDGYLQTDKTYFVVVGLAHYLGDESVIKYLEDKGYTVERK